MKTTRVVVNIKIKNDFHKDGMKNIYRDASIKFLEQFVNNSRKTQGCLQCDLLQDDKDLDDFALVEAWETKEAFEAHISSPYFLQFSHFLAEYVDNLKIHRMKRIY